MKDKNPKLIIQDDEGYTTVWVTRLYTDVVITLTRPKVVTDGASAYRLGAIPDAEYIGRMAYAAFRMLQPLEQRAVKLAHGAQKEVNVRFDAYAVGKPQTWRAKGK